MEKILIIGNGFDLAHGLPTKYDDFIDFCAIWNYLQHHSANIDSFNEALALLEKEKRSINANSKINKQVINAIYSIFSFPRRLDLFHHRRINQAFSMHNDSYDEYNLIIDEFTDLIKNNIWIEYFYLRRYSLGENWIDFESEIYSVLNYLASKLNSSNSKIKSIYSCFVQRYQAINSSINKKEKFINSIYIDLNKLIRALEIYFAGVISNLEVNSKLSVIENNKFDKVISFNYTDTFRRVYKSNIEDENICFIHGEAILNNSVDSCNLVLGIQEELKDSANDVDYLIFKKFYQRIYKGTDSQYLDWISGFKDKNYELTILGHSLDVTDQEILKPFIERCNVTIYHHNKTAMGFQIKNLLEFIDSHTLINKTGGNKAAIKFVNQNDQ